MQRTLEGEEAVRLSVDLGADMHRQVRIVAALEGRSISDIVRELLAEYIEQRRRESPSLRAHL